jgi:hypothetical protein
MQVLESVICSEGTRMLTPDADVVTYETRRLFAYYIHRFHERSCKEYLVAAQKEWKISCVDEISLASLEDICFIALSSYQSYLQLLTDGRFTIKG